MLGCLNTRWLAVKHSFACNEQPGHKLAGCHTRSDWADAQDGASAGVGKAFLWCSTLVCSQRDGDAQLAVGRRLAPLLTAPSADTGDSCCQAVGLLLAVCCKRKHLLHVLPADQQELGCSMAGCSPSLLMKLSQS